MNFNKRYLILGALSLLGIIIFLFINPFAWNDATTRTVVTQMNGKQFCQFAPGAFYEGFFAKETVYPNQISVSHLDSIPSFDMEDNTIEIGKIIIRFNDATTASVAGITQFILPSTEEEMLALHNAHRSPEALVKRRLAPYTSECLQSSAQLMSSEMHYGGGRAQMTQDYLDQLKNGAFLLKLSEVNTYDSIEKVSKKVYQNAIITDKTGLPKRKFSSIKEYGITVADAQTTDFDYESRVDVMLGKKIDAATAASISRQQLMTAQQQALTAEAQGKKALVETEYKQKVQQTVEIVQAETKVKLQEQYKLEQRAAAEAAVEAAKAVRIDADAKAYANARLVSAGLTPQEAAEYHLKETEAKWEGISKVVLPSYYAPGGSSNNQSSMLEMLIGSQLIKK